jgi:pyrroline-5-carboxylate reductase
MEKLAADFKLDAEHRQKIATFTFATALASPAVGLSQEQVKTASSAFLAGLKKAAARHEKLVDMLAEHVKAPAGAK